MEMSDVKGQEDDGANQTYILRIVVLLASQVIPDQLAVLMHAFAESLQFAHRSVPGRSQRSNSAAASTGLSCASESEHHCDIIIVTRMTTTRSTYIMKSQKPSKSNTTQ